MLDTLRAWLNGKKEYYTGVALYEQLGNNPTLLNLFKKGPSEFCTRRLQEELLKICQELKSSYSETTTNDQSASKFSQQTKHSDKDNSENKEGLPNAGLYVACKEAAGKQYKQTMNDRAVLFAMADTGDFSDPNTPDKIEARAKLALAVVQGFQLTSQLYDKADHVKEHGRLPDQDDSEENEYDHLPDNLVKQTLDNLRKNYNKMKKREQTPERVALQQKHEANIEKLLKRWRSLQPAN